ncbi:MAG: cytochrome c/ABC transporter substrate-binding protein [Planctomycetota bacterium]
MGPRPRTSVSRPVFKVAILTTALLAGAALGAGLSEEEGRGKQIFFEGDSASGRDITAYVGQASVPLPASAIPCAGCHGPDGLGRPEAGVTPSNITWSHLTKPYGTLSGTGRRRPAYTMQTAIRAIAAGTDSAGNRLDASMPRYEMDPQDMAELLAYLKRLEYDLDPGLADTMIRLGSVLPKGGPTASLGEAIEGVVKAYFDDINVQGGIYSRRLELKVASAPTRELVLERGSALIKSGEIFALVAPVTAGLEAELGEIVEANQIPVIGPFTQFPADAHTLQRFTFYLFAGLTVQARALLGYASKQLELGRPRVGVVYPRGGQGKRAAEAIRGHAEEHKWPEPLLIDYPPRQVNAAAIAAQLKTADTQALVFLGRGSELVALTQEGVRRTWVPYVLMAGSLVDKALFDLPAAFQDRVFVAYPTVPSDHTPAGKQEFGRFHQRHNLPRKHFPAQIAAYSAAKLLVEGLKTAGRGLSRDKLVKALEALHRFDTGLTPPLTYSANRRIGALGAHIVAVDLRERNFRPAADWVGVE